MLGLLGIYLVFGWGFGGLFRFLGLLRGFWGCQFHEAFSAHPINVTQINHVGGAFGHDTVLPDIPGGLYTLFLNVTRVRS